MKHNNPLQITTKETTIHTMEHVAWLPSRGTIAQ